jgi:hypothetical protein
MTDVATEEEEKREEPKNAKIYGWTDEEFKAFLQKELEKDPLYKDYPEVFSVAPTCISKWRQRYRGNPRLWQRLFQKNRVLKEFVEAVPIIDAVQRLVLTSNLEGSKKFTIMDLACGRGYLSMFLSEILPPEKVEKLILVDKQWAQHDMAPKAHHISWTHIYGSLKEVEDQSIPRYYDTWPISLNTSKKNLKASKQIKKMEELYFKGKGPVIIVAVHLCGTLSLKAVELFNNNPEARFLCLKPCCLPGMIHAKRDEIFQLGEHSFDAKLVCMAGKWKKNVWKGPPRQQLRSFFQRWADNLFLGINTEDAAKIQKTVVVQSDGGYQNEFLFAERLPETDHVWKALRPKDEPTAVDEGNIVN